MDALLSFGRRTTLGFALLALTSCAAWPGVAVLGAALGMDDRGGSGFMALLGLLGASPGSGTTDLIPPAPPTIAQIYLYDCTTDGETTVPTPNGIIDEIVIEFSEAMKDSSFGISDLTRVKFSGRAVARIDSTTAGTTGAGIGTATCSLLANGGVDPGAANDKYVTVFANDTMLLGVEGTDARPFAYTSSSGRFTDSADNSLDTVSFLASDSALVDRARPVLLQATTETGTTGLRIIFSEPVDASADGTCSGPLATANFTYVNASSDNAASLIAMADADGCDFLATVQATANQAFANSDLVDASDSANDTIAANATIVDFAGNAAVTSAVNLRGIIHPFVTSIVSVASTTARVRFSEEVNNTQATTTGNYSISCQNAGVCSCAGGESVSAATKVDDRTYDLTTSAQGNPCLYTITASTSITDLNELSALISPRTGTFVGSAAIRVAPSDGAISMGLSQVLITFTRDVHATDATTASLFTVSSALGSVSSAVRYDSVTGSGSDANKVLLTHSTNQGVGTYTIVVSSSLRDSSSSAIESNVVYRTASFAGYGGTVDEFGDGELYQDPFSDGSSFAFAFEYGGKIYLGPNDNNDGVFRFDPDGGNPSIVTFNISSSSGTKTTFGGNITRPAGTVENPSGTVARYYVTPGTDLSRYSTSTASVTGCTNAVANNKSGTPVVNDAMDYIELDNAVAPVTSTSETCVVLLYNGLGPAGFDGVDAFVKATLSGQDYLIFGGHNEGGGGFAEIHFTQDLDTVLDLSYCTVGSATLGNTKSLQTIYGYGTRLYTAFASDSASGQPILSIHSLGTTGAACADIGAAINGTGNTGAKRIPYLGGNGNATCGTPADAANAATNQGIDSIAYYNPGTARILIANNGGINQSTTIPPTTCTNFTTNLRRDGDGTWTGTTRQIPGIGKLRPGEKGIPFMVPFGTSLYIARNRSDNTAELWRYDGTNWSNVRSSTGNDTAISMVTVSGGYLYVGYDNATDGATVYRTGDTGTGPTWTQIGVAGFGPAGASAASRAKNKQIISNAQVVYNGRNYLYVTMGCLSDFSDNGACDRNGTLGAIDFSIKVFRQID